MAMPFLRAAAIVVLLLLAGWLWSDSEPADSPNKGPDHAATAPVEGRVVDDRGPVAGARVGFQGHSLRVLTDAAGRFRLTTRIADATLVASHPEHLIAGTSDSSDEWTIRLTRLPQQDHTGYQWVSPHADPAGEHNCANCHEEIYRQWQGGAHAQAAGSRRFLSFYAGTDWHGQPGSGWSLLDEYPDGAAVCASCHAPTHADSDDLRDAQGVASDGVHCDFCHKVQGVSTEQLGITHGQFGMKLMRPAHGQLFFGPLDDVDRGEDVYAPVYQRSEYCATCHEGVLFGVPVYTTYSEWLVSPARDRGQQCQSCHMATTGQMTNIAPEAGGLDRDPHSLASHTLMPGGKRSMIEGALDVRITVRRSSDNDTAVAEVLLRTKGIGHRLPTGFIDRHLLLIVEASQADGSAAEFLVGPQLGQVGDRSLTGKPGKLFAKQLLSPSGRAPIAFWHDHGDTRDTRLRPAQADESRFEFSAEAESIRVRLIYRPFWNDVVAEKNWPNREIVLVDQTLRLPTRDAVVWSRP